MRKLLAFLLVIAISVSFGLVLSRGCAFASPYLVCDPYPTSVTQPTKFVVTMDGGSPVNSTPQTLGDNSVRLYYDAAGLSVGSHNLTVKAVRTDPVWGDLESAPAPFSFTKPGGVGTPSGIGLSP